MCNKKILLEIFKTIKNLCRHICNKKNFTLKFSNNTKICSKSAIENFSLKLLNKLLNYLIKFKSHFNANVPLKQSP